MIRPVGDREQRSTHTGQHVNHEGLPLSEKALGKAAQAPETPHVYGNVEDTAVQESGCEEAPVLSAKCQRAVIESSLGNVQTGNHLQHKSDYVDRDQSRGYRVAA